MSCCVDPVCFVPPGSPAAAAGGVNVCRCEAFRAELLLVEWKKNNQGCVRWEVCVSACTFPPRKIEKLKARCNLEAIN